jgi:hypothetical protein
MISNGPVSSSLESVRQWQRAMILMIADKIEHRGEKSLDLDPGETADWLRCEVDHIIQEV